MAFTVFLDVDGVLNTRRTVKQTPKGYQGIVDSRVELLAQAISEYGGGDIVLSSDWKELHKDNDDYVYLEEKLAKFGLKIKDETKDKRHCERGAGIQAYLEDHPEIEEFVILDDCKWDFDEYPKLWERLLLTDGIENAAYASRTPAVEAMLFLDAIKKFA